MENLGLTFDAGTDCFSYGTSFWEIDMLSFPICFCIMYCLSVYYIYFLFNYSMQIQAHQC